MPAVPGWQGAHPAGPGRNCRALYGSLTMRSHSRGKHRTRRLRMRIEPRAFPSPVGVGGPQRRVAAGRSFSLEEGASAGKAGAASAAAPLSTVDALLALQGDGDLAERRRRSVKRGYDLLDTLDRLKAALLSGRVATADLQRLTATLAERRDLSGDPRLDDLLSHIELRAKVELAKLGIA